MGYKMKKLITKRNKERRDDRKIEYIVIHYTGNKTDTAENNAKYFYDTYRGASAHYFVGTKYVYQAVDDKDVAWSVGVNYGNNNLYGKVTNANSISVEMCSKDGVIPSATFANTVALVKKLMQKYNIHASRVVRHYDVCSKRCPGWDGWIPPKEELWKKFKKQIGSASTSKTTTATAKKSVQAVAIEVLQGKWGNGADRKKKLEEAGYDYAEVQREVNKLV